MSFSVVISTYNGEKYIDDQLQSVIDQSLPPDEIIIFDDCSTDHTWSILNDWQRKYPHQISIFQQKENVGYNQNFGAALAKVTGDYIAICDQDDIWYPNKLEVLSTFVMRYPDALLFHHGEDIIGEKPYVYHNSNHWMPCKGTGVNILFVYNRITGHLTMVKKELLQYALPIPEGIIYDWWITVVAAIKGEIVHVPEILMTYRKHEESAYFSDVKKQLRDVTKPIKHAIELFLHVEGMSQKDHSIGKQLLQLYTKHHSGKFDWAMFLFFVRNRAYFFKDYHTINSGLRRQIFIVRLCRAYSKW